MISIADKDINKKTVVVILCFAIMLSVFSTLMVLNNEPNFNLQKFSTIGSQGQVGLTILEPPKDSGQVSFEIIDPDKQE